MIVACHQPSYLPWLGYLDKLARCDVFVVMDDLQYEPQNFQNRQRVKLADGVHWLSVPLVHGSQRARICDKLVDNAALGGRHHWQRRTWRTLEIHYGPARYFARYAPALADIYRWRWDSLLELDLAILDIARGWLGITTPVLRASSLPLAGTKTERIAAVCEKLGADSYLSGSGGSTSYLDPEVLAQRGITTLWQAFRHPAYPQRYRRLGFISHLAFLDLLFNCGPEAPALMWPPAPHAAAGSVR